MEEALESMWEGGERREESDWVLQGGGGSAQFITEMQNFSLKDVVGSESSHGFKNGHFHEENSTKFLLKTIMPSLPEDLTAMQIARGWQHVLGK